MTYWGLRDYGTAGQIGLEPTPDAFVARMVEVFREVRRVLRKDGTCWVNMGDAYNSQNGFHRGENYMDGGAPKTIIYPDRSGSGLKPKDLIGMPWRVAFALQADGWYLRSDVIWAKPNPMPESVTDRPTKAHEYVFLLTKSATYYYDSEAVKESAASDHPSGNGFKRDARLTYQNANGTARGNDQQWTDVGGSRNKRSVWTIATAPFPEAHFATFPPELPEICIKAGTSQHGCCAECGAPWGRETEHFAGDAEAVGRPKRTAGMDSKTSTLSLSGNGSKEWAERGGKRVTLGWSPSCSCNADVVPATVLDPFAGAGTTLLVSDRLQRNAIGIELNPEYAAMAERRLSKDRGGLLDLMEAPPLPIGDAA